VDFLDLLLTSDLDADRAVTLLYGNNLLLQFFLNFLHTK
jgi:hypothetical protein